MKKSHRKDVIIARIIFAVMCIVLIAIIVGVVMLIRGRQGVSQADSQKQQTQVQTQIQSQMPDTTADTDIPDVPETQTEDTQSYEIVYMWTTDGVNLRSEPNTECSVVTVLEQGTQVRMVGEEDGWVKVSYNNQEGYIRADFLTDEQ